MFSSRVADTCRGVSFFLSEEERSPWLSVHALSHPSLLPSLQPLPAPPLRPPSSPSRGPRAVCPAGTAWGCQPLSPGALTELKLSQAGQWALVHWVLRKQLSPEQAQGSMTTPRAWHSLHPASPTAIP